MTKMWTIESNSLIEVNKVPLNDESRLEDWIEANPSILGLDTLLIGRQVTTAYGGRIDLLAVDSLGQLVVLELKRNKTPRDVIAQILDYASWVQTLTTKDVYEIAFKYLNKPLDQSYRERFGASIPETLNSRHNMIIIASELDESSKRIVEYLATTYDISINTAFFNYFQKEGKEFLTADWLMDQNEVVDRSESRKSAPWAGYWYVNVDEGEHRSWEDCVKYGFIAAGHGRKYSDQLYRLSDGAPIFAYQKNAGYVGYGVTVGQPVMVRDFMVDGKKLSDLPLKQSGLLGSKDDPEYSEYVVAVKWIATYQVTEAKWIKDGFANQNVVCKLKHMLTLDYLKQVFNIQDK